MNNDRLFVIIVAITVIVIISFSLWWNVSVWNECRDDGKSFMYCWNMISGR